MAEDEPTKFKVGRRTYTLIDFDELELGEQEEIEDAFNLPVEEIDGRRLKAIRYLVYFSMKRAGSDVKFEELGQIKTTDLFVDEAPEETKPAKRPTKAKPEAA